jgi:heat shock protein HslJ
MNVRRANWKWLALLLALLIVLGACGGEDPTPTSEPTAVPEEPTPVPEEPTAIPEEVEAEPSGDQPVISQPIYRWGEVADKLWVLIAYGDAGNPTVVTEGTVITAVFNSAEPTVSGSGGCNNYFTGYESTDDGGLTINGPIGGTMMFCDGLMDQEAAYFAALETVSGWALSDEGRLELTYDSGEPYDEVMVFAPAKAPLTGPTWRLVSYGDPEEPTAVLEGTSITAEFDPQTDNTGTVGGNATCNGYSTSYTIDGEQISFGPIAGTLMMCPIGADQEVAYLGALDSAQSYLIAGPFLQITYDGGVLNYTALNLPLQNVLWQAVLVGDQAVPEGVEITALFTPGETTGSGTLGGSSGCNSYNTGYETSEDLSTNPTTHFITIDPLMAMTMAICPDESLANLESTYLAALETAETYEVLGNQMVVRGASGDVLFAADREPLQGVVWALTSLGDVNDPQPPAEGSSFTAEFNRLPTLPTGTVVGTTGCNDYNATYTANLSEIKINLPAKTDNEECPWGTGNFEVEQQFFLALNAATSYRILGNVLQIPYGEPDSLQVLNFVATQPEGDPGVSLAPLDDTFWYLLSIGDNAVIPYTEITVGFEINDDGSAGLISGSGGCNAYNAEVTAPFIVGPIGSNRKACPEEVMDQEGGYLDWLSKAYTYSRAGDQLLVSTANGVLTYNSTPVQDQTLQLQNVTWYLVSAGNVAAVSGAEATTSFNNDGVSVSGNTGCNSFNGSYSTEPGNRLTVSGLTSTQAACTTDALTQQEQALLSLLESATTYVVVGTAMQIQTADGNVINYTSVPPVTAGTPSAVINGPSEGQNGEVLTFDGSGSLPSGSPIVSYAWDMGDGTILSGHSIQHSYGVAGSYIVQLTVTSQAGTADTASVPIQIYPVVEVTPPAAAITGPTVAFVGESVIFNAADSQQGSAEITSYAWQSGDGNDTGPAAGASFTTIYARPGVYYPSVIVTDANDLSDSASMAIIVNAQPEGTDWILSDTIPGTSIDILFRNGNIKGFGGCNQYNAKYTASSADGLSGTISIGPISNSSRACSEEILAQEQTYLANLQSAASFTISGDSLTLTLADGTQLVYYAAVVVPAPTPVTTQ